MALVIGVWFTAAIALTALAQGREGSQTGQIGPISADACKNMKMHHVLGSQPPVGCDRLRHVQFRFVDFDGKLHTDGEIVVMDAAAKHVRQIFDTLFRVRFPIAKARLMENYQGDDDASMKDNNTSAFNDREIIGGDRPSLHAYGLAIDINPRQNPFVTRKGAMLLFDPPIGIDYANRLNDRPWKPRRPGMAEAVADVFAQNGFLIWGGYWDNPIDYQHFQVGRQFAERLAQEAPNVAEATFDNLVERYRHCRRSLGAAPLGRITCVMQTDPAADRP